ncbi:LLM class F420-dependent oxidoreductase [Desertivibrio insolitus]|uniref:LLM class F420-dependent oxidoreductase n=1 Tax=Herbiconiux sp. SYSU D00978 TaxID=2812562 RepID=UPI001A958F95|nr:LLM class F420-dependent oxidoreductase [Herbiconiux sp. SYSU D00978]
MEFCIFTEPQQGASYDTLLATAQAAEDLGFDGWFRSDHYLVMGDGDGLPGPTDAWTTLAALARETKRVRLGTLVSSATYRYPGILAIQVAQVDQMSGGRVELGLGTGWYEQEHRAYGIPFPAKRFGLLEEQLAIVSGLLSTPLGETFSYSGEHYTLEDAPALPKPVQSPVPLIVGGGGPKKTPALAAKYATEYNAGFATVADVEAKLGRTKAAVAEAGRDAASIKYSVAGTTVTGADEATVRRRADATGTTPEDVRHGGFGGTASEVVDKIGTFKEMGITRVYFQVMDLADLDHLEFIAQEVVPQVR